MIHSIILAGGKGTRLGADIPKQLLPLGDKPIIRWSVERFHSMEEIDNIIIVSEKNSMAQIKEALPYKLFPKISSFIEGGKERYDSVFNGLTSQKVSDDDIVLIHDAARPFVTKEKIKELINAVCDYGSAALYTPPSDTIALWNNGFITEVPPRDKFRCAQTPQAFFYKIIKEAHDSYRLLKDRQIVTDDVSLVLLNGLKVKEVPGSTFNLKITSMSDYLIAQLFVRDGIIQ
ncbi:MAG: 2-C-methyl-D-erythritol 4-phosphate cytidylyltransferase [Spirochaetes bacterium]|nr:2-C-methyl-D-erythritol 4-phosphate cytidylyltransferase [Spirochaetota bacterium]